MKTIFLLFVWLWPVSASAAVGREPADTLWLIVASALVFFMQTGFALLENGLSRSKNAVNVVMKNYMDLCLGSLIFWALGFGIMFGNNPSGLFGTSHFFSDFQDPWSYTFLLFQMMFAATATTIASGAMAERTRYAGYLVGAVVITGLIYPVFGCWAWGGIFGGRGWLSELGFIDFAGSTVVHSVGAWCALAGIMIVGPRLGRFDPKTRAPRLIPGHNLNNVALGGFILWLGWFGFNAGSALAVTSDLGKIALNTQLAACAGAAATLFYRSFRREPVLLSQTVNGSLAGLVAITAGCATMAPHFAVLTGAVAGLIVIWGGRWLDALQLDDAVGAIPVHGFAGVWGTVAAGLFLESKMFDPTQIMVQFVGCIVAFAWTFPLALLVYWLIEKTFGLRADNLAQQRGLDFSEHSERGYPEFESVTLHKPIR